MNKAFDNAITWFLVVASIAGLVMGIINKSIPFIIIFALFLVYSIYKVVRIFTK